MIRREDALEYHRAGRPGKIEVVPSTSVIAPRELRLAYLPGAVFPAEEIRKSPEAAYLYTARGNLVAVMTNGSAVPGLGDVGPAAAKPMQEGIAVLFKRLADIDVFDLEIDATEPEDFVEVARRLEPTFGGINLKDLRAPEGLEIYDRLREAVVIPVFHENLYSTAIVALAGIINGLDLVDKRVEDVRIVICGAGTVGLGCARLLGALGVPRDHILMYDVHGLLHPGRDDLNRYQVDFARNDSARTLSEGLRDADVFLGASVGGVLEPDMIRSMNRFPIVFAMATPEPEIGYEEARAARRDVLVGTSRGQDPNAIVDLLSFPYVFRGALDVQATAITETMMLAAARALAELAREEVVEEVSRAYGNTPFTFGPEYLLPKAVDPRILVRQSSAVAASAIEEGVAGQTLETESYQERLVVRLGTGREVMRQIILKARQVKPRIVFPDGDAETVLRACPVLEDEGIGCPVLVGDEERVRAAADRLGVDLGGIPVVDPRRSPRADTYIDTYFRMRARRGVTLDMAQARLALPPWFAALMLHCGDADLMISGVGGHFPESMRVALEVIGTAEGVRRVSSVHMVLRPKDVYFLADCAVNIERTAEELAETALLAARMVRSLGIEPRVAMLSYSNFGSVDHPSARKVREATRLVREADPALVIEGEIQLATALDASIRERWFPFSSLPQDANILIFPDLQAGNLALHILEKVGETVSVGPVLLGAGRPVHVLQYGSTVRDVVNLAALAAVQAAGESASHA